MPSSFMVTQSPLSSMCWATCACDASTSSRRGGVNNEANCTARKIAPSSSQDEIREGACRGRRLESFALAIRFKAVKIKDNSGRCGEFQMTQPGAGADHARGAE